MSGKTKTRRPWKWAIAWDGGNYETFDHESTARLVLREKYVKEGWCGRVVRIRVEEQEQ